MCLQCAENYTLHNDVCVEQRTRNRQIHVSMTRYGTYIGLCIATCIILRKNLYLASVIGLVVALYIGLAEYTLTGTPSPLQTLQESIVHSLNA